MSRPEYPQHALLTFTESEKSPLSIRAKALVFVDPRSRQLRDQANRLASSGLAVLIRGETGTGKELLARHIHRESERGGLFVAVNCAAISPRWGQAELFGHVAGAYAGGPGSRAGWFGSASGGTLYLDEIGDLPLALQAQLLQALETREVQRLGSQQATPVDVRLVAASSIDLARAVAAGTFDERLFHYLDEGRLDLPALRERPGDILPLAEYFLGIHAQRLGLAIPQIGPAAQAALEAHAWYGNTRELENSIHFALLVCGGAEILPQHLDLPGAASLPLIERQLGLLTPQERAELSRRLGA
ncbi:sigma-54 dependent transcriptional regulator [Pseudomonas alcaligenes]|uniref:Fis family transcriptional regulator n=1 Tax=Aquipseudomonas alcaligenes TaxID=43263 RepID=A0A2V4MGQ2_AQUAC|nr:sigma 54-interacting transcriptional regulator [Pseudomonas alcaligenes]PYC29266.1 Fis family transcriptional regulator [Pseudomonas alcaligenes]